MRLIDLSFDEPAMNLALDESLLDAAEEGHAGECLRFWESPVPFVVLGTAQELHREADEAACAAEGVPIMRRCTAGGCVLQGPGSLNYALVILPELRPETRTLKGSYCYILHALSDAFAALGLDVIHEGTCDLTTAGRKVSGNAQRRRRRALLFHGTFLHGMELALVTRWLLPPSSEPAYRAGRDHEAFVANLPCPPDVLREVLAGAWKATPAPVPEDAGRRVERLMAVRYGRAEWHERRA